jgi:hypothetical protein
MNKFYLIAIFIFLIVLPKGEAISFGSLLKKDLAIIKADESAKFEILFWNVEDKPYEVKLEVEEYPENWFVIIQPKEFTLSSSLGEEYINLPYLEKPVKAFLVNVFVKPSNSIPGKYQVVIRAKAGIPQEGIAFFQERKFNLLVEIKSEENFENTSSIKAEPSFSIEKIAEKINFEARELKNVVNSIGEIVVKSNSIFYILAIIAILIISFIIYKYA